MLYKFKRIKRPWYLFGRMYEEECRRQFVEYCILRGTPLHDYREILVKKYGLLNNKINQYYW